MHYFGKPRNIYEIKQLPIDTIEFVRFLQGKEGSLEEMSATQLEFFCEDLFELKQDYQACKETNIRMIKLSLKLRIFKVIDNYYELEKFPDLFQQCKEIPEDFFWRTANNNYEGIDRLKQMIAF